MTDNLPFEQLVEWIEGNLDEAKNAEIEAQLAQADDKTQITIAWLRSILQAGDKIVLETIPQMVRVRLTERFDTYARDRQQPSFFQRLMASLTFDSGLNPVPAGVREANLQSQSQQLVYSADNTDITLHIYRIPDVATITISGQIFSEDGRPLDIFSIQLIQDGVETDLTTADELGEFTFTAVPNGRYSLILSSDSIEIMIPEIIIPE